MIVMGSVFTLFYIASLFAFDLLTEAERQTIADWFPIQVWRHNVRGAE